MTEIKHIFKDKNGKKICKGNIIKRKKWKPYLGRVSYYEGIYWVETLDEGLGIDTLEHFISACDGDIEIIEEKKCKK